MHVYYRICSENILFYCLKVFKHLHFLLWMCFKYSPITFMLLHLPFYLSPNLCVDSRNKSFVTLVSFCNIFCWILLHIHTHFNLDFFSYLYIKYKIEEALCYKLVRSANFCRKLVLFINSTVQDNYRVEHNSHEDEWRL